MRQGLVNKSGKALTLICCKFISMFIKVIGITWNMLGMELLLIRGKMGRLSLSDVINVHRDGSLPAHLPSNIVFMYERFHFMTIVLHILFMVTLTSKPIASLLSQISQLLRFFIVPINSVIVENYSAEFARDLLPVGKHWIYHFLLLDLHSGNFH